MYRRRSLLPWRRPPAPDACSDLACGEPATERCCYVDNAGEECATLWCPPHSQPVDGVAYCRRHAGVIRGLTPSLQRDLPGVTNRAPSLVIWVGRSVDADVRDMLSLTFEDRAGVRMERVVPEHRGDTCVWVLRWIAKTSAVTCTLSLEVSEDADTLVTLRAGAEPIFAAVPPWISLRADGNPTAETHVREARGVFYRDFFTALHRYLGGAEVPAATTPERAAATV